MYGPVRTVVWEGRSRKAPPYPDSAPALAGDRPGRPCGKPLRASQKAVPRATGARGRLRESLRSRGEPIPRHESARRRTEETQKRLAISEASTHERSRSPESVFTIPGFGVQLHRKTQHGLERDGINAFLTAQYRDAAAVLDASIDALWTKHSGTILVIEPEELRHRRQSCRQSDGNRRREPKKPAATTRGAKRPERRSGIERRPRRGRQNPLRVRATPHAKQTRGEGNSGNNRHANEETREGTRTRMPPQKRGMQPRQPPDGSGRSAVTQGAELRRCAPCRDRAAAPRGLAQEPSPGSRVASP